MQARKKLGLGN
jgi:mitogen-activated protein kinase 1/3